MRGDTTREAALYPCLLAYLHILQSEALKKKKTWVSSKLLVLLNDCLSPWSKQQTALPEAHFKRFDFLKCSFALFCFAKPMAYVSSIRGQLCIVSIVLNGQEGLMQTRSSGTLRP